MFVCFANQLQIFMENIFRQIANFIAKQSRYLYAWVL